MHYTTTMGSGASALGILHRCHRRPHVAAALQLREPVRQRRLLGRVLPLVIEVM
jgi:hypothetical protein